MTEDDPEKIKQAALYLIDEYFKRTDEEVDEPYRAFNLGASVDGEYVIGILAIRLPVTFNGALGQIMNVFAEEAQNVFEDDL